MAKPFAAFDVDGTIFKSSLAEKVADGCVKDGLFPAEAFNVVYANKRKLHTENNEDVYTAYMNALVGAFVQHIAGVELERFLKITDDMVKEHQVRKFAFPRRLIRAVEDSHHIVAISGSPDILVRPFLSDLPVDDVYGSVYDHEEGKFTGNATAVGDKASILGRLVSDGVVRQVGSVAVGDTATDISMLEYAQTPIMFNASQALTVYGAERGWTRVIEVKDQVTALQMPTLTEAYVEIDPVDVIGQIRE